MIHYTRTETKYLGPYESVPPELFVCTAWPGSIPTHSLPSLPASTRRSRGCAGHETPKNLALRSPSTSVQVQGPVRPTAKDLHRSLPDTSRPAIAVGCALKTKFLFPNFILFQICLYCLESLIFTGLAG